MRLKHFLIPQTLEWHIDKRLARTHETPRLEFLYALGCLGASFLRPDSYSDAPLPAGESPKHHMIYRQGMRNDPLPPKLSVASWNMYHGHMQGVDVAVKKLAEKHDILFLQEAPSPDHSHLYDCIADWHFLYAPDRFYSADNPCLSSGNLIVSKHKLHAPEVVDLPRVTWQYHGRNSPVRRNALFAVVGDGSSAITLCNTHLDIYCSPKSRLRQFGPVLERVSSSRSILGMDANLFQLVFGKEQEPLLNDLHHAGLKDTLLQRPRLIFSDYIFTTLPFDPGEKMDMHCSDHFAITTNIYS